ncbi:NEDD8 ultimate buster 1-like isoform X2 [Heterodontus francisci]|uniref:NEDD8 ultimate buster 1-like isoform X2 n=1 Tax=Heterodontus francisci TaxID=7792 RepID=UPI00355B768B
MAEGRQTKARQQEQDTSDAMDNSMEVSQAGRCNSSGHLVINVTLPKSLSEKQEKITIKISPNAVGLQLFEEISEKLPNIEAKNVQLIHKAKKLNKDMTLAEQNVKNKGKVMLTLINEDKREQTFSESSIRKTAESLAKQDEDFEKPYLNVINHKGEIIEVPKEKRVVILTALILHEVGRSDMKKGNYEQALTFLHMAEHEFSKCDDAHLNSIDNCGVLNLDVIWCNLQLQKIQCFEKARERLEKAEEYFNNCFGKNQERLQELEDNSGRHRVLFLRLYVLWGVWFYYNKMEKEALENLDKADALLSKLQVDDVDVTDLTNQGFTTQEARLGLRATEGDIENAKLFIKKRRERPQLLRREAEERRDQPNMQMDIDNTEQAVPDWANQVSLPSAPAIVRTSQPPDESLPSVSTSSTSPPTGAQGSSENDDILKEILSQDSDDYINETLEEEELLIHDYKSRITQNASKNATMKEGRD